MSTLRVEMSDVVRCTSDSVYSLGDIGENSTILRIEKLEERVRQLELQSYGGKQLDVTRYQKLENEIIGGSSKPTIVAESSIANACCTMKTLISTRKLARFQCIWLLLVLICFTFYAIDGYLEANKNENSQWKPQRKTSNKDYGVLEDEQYSMPFFFMEFYVTELKSNHADYDCPVDDLDMIIANCAADRSWSDEEMMDTFSDMWGVEPNWDCGFECVGSVEYYQISDKLSCEFTTGLLRGQSFDIAEVIFGVIHPYPWVENMFMGYIGFKPEDPEPGSLWTCSLEFSPEGITMGTSLFVDQYILRMNNDDNPDFLTDFTQGIEFEIWNILSEDQKNVFEVGYKETVLKLYQMNIPFISRREVLKYTYDVEIEEEKFDESLPYTVIRISPDMPVEEWEEYLEYSYLNWVASMGGFLTMLSLLYFRIAALLISWLGENEWDMGFLPMMSRAFKNREILYWMKAQLTGTHVLEPP